MLSEMKSLPKNLTWVITSFTQLDDAVFNDSQLRGKNFIFAQKISKKLVRWGSLEEMSSV